jgi:lysophospholipase L1-like esterase
MNKNDVYTILLLALLMSGCMGSKHYPKNTNASADKNTYLQNIREELAKQWPNNRTITIVCHGHSVPAGYFNTPVTQPFDSYPHLLHRALNEKYPNAVINVIVTAIGGENCISGVKRFDTDVLGHQPDVILIDYALNDRNIGLDQSATAWSSMIQQAKDKQIKMLLLTPTPDIQHVPDDNAEDLNHHADQIRLLAKRFNIGLVDSLAAFDNKIKDGMKIQELLSNGYNHPNREGHEIVVKELLEWL